MMTILLLIIMSFYNSIFSVRNALSISNSCTYISHNNLNALMTYGRSDVIKRTSVTSFRTETRMSDSSIPSRPFQRSHKTGSDANWIKPPRRRLAASTADTLPSGPAASERVVPAGHRVWKWPRRLCCGHPWWPRAAHLSLSRRLSQDGSVFRGAAGGAEPGVGVARRKAHWIIVMYVDLQRRKSTPERGKYTHYRREMRRNHLRNVFLEICSLAFLVPMPFSSKLQKTIWRQSCYSTCHPGRVQNSGPLSPR